MAEQRLLVGLEAVDALLGQQCNAEVRIRIDSNRLRAITGTRTFSSKAPCVPATVTAMSLPITWAATWSTTSGITGLTLPGMIEEPFCSSGSASSTRPVRGPEPISTRSLAILVSGPPPP